MMAPEALAPSDDTVARNHDERSNSKRVGLDRFTNEITSAKLDPFGVWGESFGRLSSRESRNKAGSFQGDPMTRCHPLVASVRMLLIVALSGALVSASEKDDVERDFESLFDGKTLNGWRAAPQDGLSDWSVKEGRIVGLGSANRLNYLVWKDERLTDFELRLEYRLPGKGNTGVEVRAQRDKSGKRPFEGYHADLGHVGIGPHILGAWDFHFANRKEHACHRGDSIVIDGNQVKKRKVKSPTRRADIRQGDWNSVRIIARGNHLRFYINDKLASEFVDNTKEGRLDHGAIGLQIHDKGMQIEFRNIRLKRLTKK